MTEFDNSVRNWRGTIEGYLCSECLQVKPKMWGTVCNECRETERRHQELIAAIKAKDEKQ